MIISFDAEIVFDKNQPPPHAKSLTGVQDARSIPKHNKINIQQANTNIK